MHRFTRQLGLAAAVALGVHAGAARAGDYTFSWISAGDGVGTQAFGLNNLGDVVGSAYANGNNWHAALWQNGVHTDLGGVGSGPFDFGEAHAINDTGQIVGWSSTEGWREQATLWQANTTVDLHDRLVVAGRAEPIVQLSLTPLTSHALAINQSGVVVGQDNTRYSVWPVQWQLDSGVSNLRWAVIMNPWQTSANAINNVGQVAGTSRTATSASAHAVLWTGGVPQELGNLGGRDSFAYGINDQGQVVGASELQGNVEMHATFWSGSSVLDLGTLGGTESQANDINGDGRIVGWAKTGTGQSHATLWIDGVAVDLNSLMDPALLADGWTLVEATAINEGGWIVGNASREGLSLAFMLRPVAVPEASMVSMMLIGCLAISGVSRHRQQSVV